MILNHLKIVWRLKYKELGGGTEQENCLKVLVDMDKTIINYISSTILQMKSVIKKKWNKKKIAKILHPQKKISQLPSIII